MGVVLVGLECIEGDIEPATDLLERGPEIGRDSVGHHFSPVLRSQDDMGVQSVHHMFAIPPIGR